MGFSKEQIRAAKEGEHWVQWAPGQVEACTVSKVRGDFVWVRTSDGQEVRLNGTASRMAIQGELRKRPKS